MTAEIIVGLIFGPTILGRFFPTLHQFIFPLDPVQQGMLDTVAWLGVLFLLLETGLEIDFSSAWRQRGDALKIALSDIIIPMVIAFVPCFFLPDYYLANIDRRLIFAVFMATVMTISAMPITAKALHDLKLSKSDLGFLIMSALSVNDIIGWLIFTIVLGIFTQTSFNLGGSVIIFLSTIGFTVFCLSWGRRFADYVISKINSNRLPEPSSSLTFICLLGFLCGAITQRFGIHALFGFFLAGIIAGEAKALSERTRQIISQMVYALFVPIFFVNIGLKVDFYANFDLFLVSLLSVIGISARFIGAWLGVNFTKVDKTNRLAIAIAHIPGGVMEIVVGLLALEYKLITEPVFVAIVFSAVLSSVILGPWLSYAINKRKQIAILEFFSRAAVIPDLVVSGRDEAIKKLCEVVSVQEEMPDAAPLYSAVLNRENVMGTAVEDGIAVPHARGVFVKKPVIAFGRSTSGIEWNAPDGSPSNFIFLILIPSDNDVQVQILSSIMKAFSDKEARGRLKQARDSQEIWSLFQEVFSAHIIVKKA